MTQSTTAGAENTRSAATAIPFRERLSYGAGDLASNLSWNLIGSFLLFYYTNVALLPVTIVGSVFLVARVLDAVVDPFIGYLIDRTRSRFGKARPWILFGSIPFAIIGTFVFWSPSGSEGLRIVYAFATFLVLGILYSTVNVPYAALLPMISRERKMRVQLGSARAIGSSIGSIAVTAAATPLVIALGGSTSSKAGWLAAAAIFSTGSLVFFLVCFFGTRERAALPAAADRRPIRQALRDIAHNRAWVVTFLYGLFGIMRLGFLLSITIYFCLEVLKAPWAISLMLPMLAVGNIVGGFLAPVYYARLGKRRGTILAIIASLIIACILPFCLGSMIAFLIVYVLSCITFGISTTVFYPLVAEAIDFHQWKFGYRNEGLLSSGISFAQKVGFAVASACVAYALGWVGYNAGHPTASALVGISVLYFAIPAGLLVLQLIVMFFYVLEPGFVQTQNEMEVSSTQALTTVRSGSETLAAGSLAEKRRDDREQDDPRKP